MCAIWGLFWTMQEWVWVYFKTTSELSLLTFFWFYLRNNKIEIMVNKRATLRVSPELSIYLRYLHQDQNVSIRSLSQRYFPVLLFNNKSCSATIQRVLSARHMEKENWWHKKGPYQCGPRWGSFTKSILRIFFKWWCSFLHT